jgi:methionyl aminopeptidase
MVEDSEEGHEHHHDEEAEKEAREKLAKSGKIARLAREKGAELAKPGVPLLDIAEKVEAFIREQGGVPAFPVNLSANENAAHSTPSADDKAVVGEKDVLKIDVGVHIDGWLSDTAITVDLSGEWGTLMEASQLALENALSIMKAGTNTKDIGRQIEQTIKSKGYRPVENLCGHSLEPWILHAGAEIPNIESGGRILEEGEVFAVEPFATNGSGLVHESTADAEIYSVAAAKPVRLPASRKLLGMVMEEYKLLPFAKRWLQEMPSLNLAINDLTRQGVLHAYPILKENSGARVTQAETTVIIEDDGVTVLV